MAQPVQLILPWEIELALVMLNKTIAEVIPDTKNQLETYQNLIALQIPLTVDMLRAQFGYGPHPDGNNQPKRGQMFIFQTDPGGQAGDSTIPAATLVNAWNTVFTLNASSAFPVPLELLEVQYAVLFAAASAAAAGSNGSLILLM